MNPRSRRLVIAMCVAAASAHGGRLAAQAAPALAGAELRSGVVFTEDAKPGLGIIAEVDLGYVWRPQLRMIAGLGRYTANIDREPGDDEGSFSANGVWAGARYDVLTRRTTGAYVRAALTMHHVQADAWDSDVDALLSGTAAGAALAVGARRTLDSRGRVHATAELRRVFMNNLQSTTLEIGLRLLRRGPRAYEPDVTTTAARSPETPPPVRAATPGEPAGRDTAAERRAAAAGRIAADREARADAAAAADRDARAAQQRAAQQQAARRDAEQQAEAATRAARLQRAAASEALLRQGLARATAAMESLTDMRETDSGFVLTLGGGAFASGAAELSRSARGELRVLATVLAGYPGHIVIVEGHTDSVGEPAANQALSAERAAAVRAALVVEGVDPLWTAATGAGATRPIASNDTAAGRAANRRVEIRVARQPCDAPPLPTADGGLRCAPPSPRP